MSSFAFVTKSYRGDFELCRSLCQGIDRHMPETTHYLLVDAADLKLFEPLATNRRKLVDCSALLPKFKELDLLGRRLWWRFPATFVRGWIYQQLAKIAFVAEMEEGAAVHIDSDVHFRAPLDERFIVEGATARLLRNPGGGASAQHDDWHRIAQKSLGLPITGYSGCDYIGPGVVWSPDQVRAMIERLEAVSGRAWYDTLAGHFRFSEYLLYGTFCDKLGLDGQTGLPSGDWSFCHLCWGHDLSTEQGVQRFVEAAQPHHACVLIQSNLGIDYAKRSEILHRIDARLEPTE
ncbi:DUF6492 family protein [Altererythrobacter sp. Z27]|uniref:DUF6492 family protein n=1 Tax=Altererythrobacter sp. Z27 TaxID=3461147 RepID=UPI004044DA40